MVNYDIFNGDADGICALVQLRRDEPRVATLVTGVKRDINLLDRIHAKSGDHVTVLDISMRTNADGLARALKTGAHVFYVDHHNAGDIPRHENLQAVIDTRPSVCTSLLVNKCLNGRFQDWAIVGAFGDNMAASAHKIIQNTTLTAPEVDTLKTFGELLNYNAYGRDMDDLHFPPADLYRCLANYDDPHTCLREEPEILEVLQAGFETDLQYAHTSSQLTDGVFLLDDAAWARRISGTFGNMLARQNPEQAHAVLSHNLEGGYLVSVRAPLNHLKGADTLCMQFDTGGGRASAAGINHLPHDQFETFLEAFSKAF
ncbi:MAG TPA: DHH family phosphoesterase [Hellea balneolensis]|uniref:DHH family phosphoesterase n=1 Tax=Hellea balneolensis TaxID=287478 RepID=A0A7C3GA93_9PROT|nr:DHH family phosphoesterase [Hellea balneolensis]